uniref:Uncharacterized protein n=1 Tax=Anopheles culicifacies TaxID=139723 RepID=A0A182LV86_9DIPT
MLGSEHDSVILKAVGTRNDLDAYVWAAPSNVESCESFETVGKLRSNSNVDMLGTGGLKIVPALPSGANGTTQTTSTHQVVYNGMDCCSSTSYVDYRHHSMNGNFCYPYSPNMLRSASPYPLAGTGRYGTDYRSSPLGYHHHGVYEGYDKYYGGYHHASSSYQTGYYGNYPSSYRDYGGYGHYYHQSQSPYARGGGSSGAVPPGYGGSVTGSGGGGGGYLYPGRHYPASASSLAHPFGSSRESSYYHAQREHHQQQYGSYANYGHLAPYRNGMGHEHPGGKSHHQPQQSQHQQPYLHTTTQQQTFAGSHNERALTGSAGSEGGTTTTASHPSPPTTTLFGAQNGYSSSSSDYTLPTTCYSSTADDSPKHSLADEGDAALTPTATPTPSTALLGATAVEFPHGTKDNRMRKPKERKLHRAYGGGSGRSSRANSPAAPPVNGLSGSNGTAATTRMKSLDALTLLGSSQHGPAATAARATSGEFRFGSGETLSILRSKNGPNQHASRPHGQDARRCR